MNNFTVKLFTVTMTLGMLLYICCRDLLISMAISLQSLSIAPMTVVRVDIQSTAPPPCPRGGYGMCSFVCACVGEFVCMCMCVWEFQEIFQI